MMGSINSSSSNMKLEKDHKNVKENNRAVHKTTYMNKETRIRNYHQITYSFTRFACAN